MMRSFMYLRPGNLTKDFIIEQHSTSLSEIGRPKTAYQDDGNCMLKGVLAEADIPAENEMGAVAASDHTYDCPDRKTEGES